MQGPVGHCKDLAQWEVTGRFCTETRSGLGFNSGVGTRLKGEQVWTWGDRLGSYCNIWARVDGGLDKGGSSGGGERWLDSGCQLGSSWRSRGQVGETVERKEQ